MSGSLGMKLLRAAHAVENKEFFLREAAAEMKKQFVPRVIGKPGAGVLLLAMGHEKDQRAGKR